MTKPFTLGDEFENEDSSHLKKNKIVSLLKEKFDFENSHLRPPSSKEKGILAKCFGYFAPEQAKELGIYPYFREVQETDRWHRRLFCLPCGDLGAHYRVSSIRPGPENHNRTDYPEGHFL